MDIADLNTEADMAEEMIKQYLEFTNLWAEEYDGSIPATTRDYIISYEINVSETFVGHLDKGTIISLRLHVDDELNYLVLVGIFDDLKELQLLSAEVDTDWFTIGQRDWDNENRELKFRITHTP